MIWYTKTDELLTPWQLIPNPLLIAELYPALHALITFSEYLSWNLETRSIFYRQLHNYGPDHFSPSDRLSLTLRGTVVTWLTLPVCLLAVNQHFTLPQPFLLVVWHCVSHDLLSDGPMTAGAGVMRWRGLPRLWGCQLLLCWHSWQQTAVWTHECP